jgi:peptide chain release factor 2
VLREKGTLERLIKDYDSIAEMKDEIETLLELAEECEDPETGQEASKQIDILEGLVRTLETKRLLSETHDGMDALVEINAGAGGTDACDWAQMLVRMYMRWADQSGFSVELLDESPAEEAGIRSATLAIRGQYAFGYMQSETGVHRLVRISPFDQASRRHTAFAAVLVFPDIDETIEVDLNPADIRMDTMRASGAGGQHINTTDSAVRLTHIPTGIVVLCRAERSQHKNKDKAMKTLRAKLYQLELEKQQEAQDEFRSDKKKIDFGSQIRSYVLQPYQQVKDLRTGETAGDVNRVLDGSVTSFMESWLAARAENDNKG